MGCGASSNAPAVAGPGKDTTTAPDKDTASKPPEARPAEEKQVSPMLFTLLFSPAYVTHRNANFERGRAMRTCAPLNRRQTTTKYGIIKPKEGPATSTYMAASAYRQMQRFRISQGVDTAKYRTPRTHKAKIASPKRQTHGQI